MPDGRRADLRVIYQGVDITADLKPWLLSWSYAEGLEKADCLEIGIQDADGRWRSNWAPQKGDSLQAEIILRDDTTQRLPCGEFSIDAPGYSGPPDVLTLKAISAEVASNVRREKKSRTWEKISLRQVAQKIADTARLQLYWQATVNPTYQKLSQNQSDLAFIAKLCDREGLRVKVGDGRLVIFPQATADAAAGVLTIIRGSTAVIDYSFERDSLDTYRACSIRYRDEKKKKVLSHTYAAPSATAEGQVLQVTERCESLAEAQRVARARLMAANRGLLKAEMTLVGDVRLASGINVMIQGWGIYDGKYAVEECTHAGPAYTTKLNMRQVSAS